MFLSSRILKRSGIVFLLILNGILFSGCFATHNGLITGTASLSSNNFTIVEHELHGTSRTIMFFGFGGILKDGLVNEAKKDLLRKHELKKNEALANVVVDFKTSFYFGIFITRECFITADIVPFN